MTRHCKPRETWTLFASRRPFGGTARNRLAVLAAVLLHLATPAAADESQGEPLVPLSKIDYPIRSVERPVTLTRGWIEVALGFSVLGSNFYYDGQENRVDGSYDYRLTTLSLRGRYGFSRNLTLGFLLPFEWKRLRNENEVELEDSGMGDASLWVTWQFYGRPKPLTSLALQIGSRVPSGNESPGTVNNSGLQTLINSRGTYSLSAALLGKQQLADFCLEAEAAYLWRMSGTVMFVQGLHGENGQINWGDEVYGRVGAGYQIPDALVPYLGTVLFPYLVLPLHAIGGVEVAGLHLGGSVRWAWWDRTAWGIRDHLQEQPFSDGWVLEVLPSLRLEIARHWEFELRATVPLAGRNTNYAFPLDTAGISGSAELCLRF